MNINFNNVEELIFYNKKVQSLLPEFRNYFAQWELGKITPALRSLGKRSMLDFLNALEPKHLQILSDHFGYEVALQKMEYNSIKNLCCGLDEVEDSICGIEGFVDLAIHRNNDQIYICFWR